MGTNNEKEGRRVGIIAIIVVILMILITLYEFVQCASGKKGHDKWDNTHVQVVKPMQNNVNTFILS